MKLKYEEVLHVVDKLSHFDQARYLFDNYFTAIK